MTSDNIPPEVPPSRVYAGDFWRYDELRFQDADSGSPFDLTQGYAGWRAQFRPSPGSATVIDLDVDAVGAPSGVIVVSCPGVRTQMMGTDGWWDLQALDGDGQPVTFVRSRIIWIQDVTRP